MGKSFTSSAGRHELLEHEGLEHHPEIPAYALSELQLKYKKPLRSQDAFLITVAVEKMGRAKVIFNQRIIRLDKHPDQDLVPSCHPQHT
jgi:acyl-CoA thioesterase FadM